MVKRKEIIYRCEYCNKPYFSHSGCKSHESKCFHDEKSKSCITCRFSDYGDCQTESVEYGEEISSKLVVNCKAWESLTNFLEGAE